MTDRTPTAMNHGLKFVAFDIEIATEIPNDATDWLPYRPLGITCAATLTTEEDARCWYKESSTGSIGAQMGIDDLRQLIHYLTALQDTGYKIVTWNGLGFDFNILSEESHMVDECKRMALAHVDMMFHFLCIKGFPLGLDKAAKGMGLAGKPVGMDGYLAPKLWKEGRHREVLEYVSQDVATTLQLALVVQKARKINWISNRGIPQTASFPNGLSVVTEAMTLPEPDTSWMSNPTPRQHFYEWLSAR